MQTVEAVSIDRDDLIHSIERLPDIAIQRIKGFVEQISEEMELEEIDKEIAALEARYGTVPNAKTIAAIKEAEADGGEITTIEEIRARCNAIR